MADQVELTVCPPHYWEVTSVRIEGVSHYHHRCVRCEAEKDVPLSATTGLGFYTYFEGRWQRVAEVKAIQNGNAAGDFATLPGNVAVLRVKERQYQVAGSLPAGGTLHTDANVDILSPRDYTPASDGSIAGTGSKAPSQGSILFMPTVVGSGQDTAAVVNDILADDSRRSKHIQALVDLARGDQVDGVDLEYSSVNADRESDFTDFVKTLADKLHHDNKRLSLTLPPPSNQRQAYNWKMLGQSADIIKILPIADPQAYWQTMPAAIAQITKDVDPSKVMLVVSPFSVEGGGNTSRPIGYLQAMVQAAEAAVREPVDPNDIKPGTAVKLVAKSLDETEGASPIRWDDGSATVSYVLGGTERKRIFIENSFSVAFKLEIVQAYALGGVALSDASAQSDVANVWPTIRGLVQSATVTLLRPNDSNLLPIWQAPDGGDLGAGAGTTASWVPNKMGTYNLILVVSDGERRFGRKILVEVKAAPELSSTPLVTFGPTPTPAATTITPTPTSSPVLKVQIGKRADGDDPDLTFEDPEETSPGSEVTYRIVIDNDAAVPVKIISLTDDKYPGIVCSDADGANVIGRTLAEEGIPGDGPTVDDQGSDAATCTFKEPAPASPPRITDVVTVVVEDAQGNRYTDFDDATVTTCTGPCA